MFYLEADVGAVKSLLIDHVHAYTEPERTNRVSISTVHVSVTTEHFSLF